MIIRTPIGIIDTNDIPLQNRGGKGKRVKIIKGIQIKIREDLQ